MQRNTIEARRVRFESIEGLQRRDLPLAGEVWLRDLCAAPWITRDAMKLGAHFVRYMASADPRQLSMARIEHQAQIGKDEIGFALRLMRLYRAIEAYTIDGDEIRVALHLGQLQRLAVLEARHRFEDLTRETKAEAAMPEGGRWVPPQPAVEDLAEASRAAG